MMTYLSLSSSEAHMMLTKPVSLILLAAERFSLIDTALVLDVESRSTNVVLSSCILLCVAHGGLCPLNNSNGVMPKIGKKCKL